MPTETVLTETVLADPEGIRVEPARRSGVGVLTLAGSSGRVDTDRARVLAAGTGALVESIRWFGGHGQHSGPWEIPIELFLGRVDRLAAECDRVVLVGLSFGAEAALVTAALTDQVAAVVAFAPTDVVWAGVRKDGTQTSHWTRAGTPLPFVPFREDVEPEGEPPAFRGVYAASYAADPAVSELAAIAVENIAEVVLVAGGDDQVWPATDQADRIVHHRARHGLATTLVTDPEAGHRAVLPGEPLVTAGQRIARGGTESADRRLGAAVWPHLVRLLS